MRMIDADALEAFVKTVRQGLYLDKTLSDMPTRDSMLLNFQQYVHLQPTISAVPVVRCKDCVWFMSKHIKHNDGTITYVGENAMPVSINVGINVQARCCRRDYVGNLFVSDNGNDFCSYGERKEDRK